MFSGAVGLCVQEKENRYVTVYGPWVLQGAATEKKESNWLIEFKKKDIHGKIEKTEMATTNKSKLIIA